MRFIQFHLIAILFLYVVSSEKWSYKDDTTGPDCWPQVFPTCRGSRQSPIALKYAECILFSFPPFEFTEYDSIPCKTVLANNGHTASVELIVGRPPTVSGAGLPGVYQFMQYHFHWGSDCTQGSEHTLNGCRYPLEMHAVHFKKEYGSATNAMTKYDGIAVLAILFEVSPYDNRNLQPLVEGLARIEQPGTSTEICLSSPILQYYSRRNVFSFYRYWGSLTTPDCYESVIWTVFVDTIPISESQLNAFRRLKDGENQPLVNNFRPTQINNQKVYFAVP